MSSLQQVPESGRDFDFLHGRWSVIHRKLVRRLSGCTDWYIFPGTLEVEPLLDGRGNFDLNRLSDPTGEYEAHSLRLFDARTGSWSIWWIDWRRPNEFGPPVRGGFEDGNGSFFGDDRFEDRPIRVRTTYRQVGPHSADWTQAFAPVGHDDWEVNWIMEFERRT
jgi:hypothetical protein